MTTESLQFNVQICTNMMHLNVVYPLYYLVCRVDEYFCQPWPGPLPLTIYVKGKGLANKRGQLIKKVMAEKGLSLPQASKYIKEHKLM